MTHFRRGLTVGFLVASTSSWTTEFLRFAATWISYQESSVILDENVFQFLLGGLINICQSHKNTLVLLPDTFPGVLLTFLVEGNECLGNCLADGIDLGYMTTSLNPHANINSSKLFLKSTIALIDFLRFLSPFPVIPFQEATAAPAICTAAPWVQLCLGAFH